ncbi:hypothetical protein CapIbe_008262, partial [Capra ibex]
VCRRRRRLLFTGDLATAAAAAVPSAAAAPQQRRRRRRRRPLPSHSDTASRGGGRGGVGTAAAPSSGAPGEGRPGRSPRAFVGAAAGATATAAAAGNYTGSSVPGCSSCCHDDDVTDGGSGAGTQAGGRVGVFLPPPPGTPRGRRLQESRARAGHGESMTRPVGTATWGGIGRSRGDRARLADRHFTSCREGGGSRGNGLLQEPDTRVCTHTAPSQLEASCLGQRNRKHRSIYLR